jgi:nucleoid DNA-binding protein
MERRPGRALATTYVRPTSPGRYQVRVRDARTGRDIKVTSDTIKAAVETARRKADKP